MMFVTGNKGKYEEAKTMIPGLEWANHLEVPEIQADTLEEVARFSAEYAYKQLGKPCFVEDAGLFVHGLKGFPGVYSKYVQGTVGKEGVLKLLDRSTDRTAHFEACIAYHDGKKVHTFTGRVDGAIALEARGTGGFGYDPIFLPAGRAKTFAEDPEYKNEISHRRRAMDKLVAFLGGK